MLCRLGLLTFKKLNLKFNLQIFYDDGYNYKIGMKYYRKDKYKKDKYYIQSICDKWKINLYKKTILPESMLALR